MNNEIRDNIKLLEFLGADYMKVSNNGEYSIIIAKDKVTEAMIKAYQEQTDEE